MKGDWYSICWSPRDFDNPNSFIELDGCPRFYFSKDGKPPSATDLESRFPHLFVKEIFKTTVFTENDDLEKMPTHYRYGIFMPGQNDAYDRWLVKSFRVNTYILEKIQAEEKLLQKEVFLEYASKLIRHDMHSGINTYIPRGLQGLIKKIPDYIIKEYQLELHIKLLEEGLDHAKKVYDRVRNFTDLVKENPELGKEEFDLSLALIEYFKNIPISEFIEVRDSFVINANKTLICTAIENFVSNGLRYNDSEDKKVIICSEKNRELLIKDNGIGMKSKEFEEHCKPNSETDKTKYGLGINIAASILSMHGFKYFCKEEEVGTTIKIAF